MHRENSDSDADGRGEISRETRDALYHETETAPGSIPQFRNYPQANDETSEHCGELKNDKALNNVTKGKITKALSSENMPVN